MPDDRVKKPGGSVGMSLSRSFAARICSVEGMVLSPALEKTFGEFDRLGLSPAQRRAAIRKHFQVRAPKP